MKVLIPIPNTDFDPTEVAIPWSILIMNNIQVIFATPNGKNGRADNRMLTGKGLGSLKWALIASKDAINTYNDMLQNRQFNNPIKYENIDVTMFDGLILPGGHDSGMKDYLESTVLQDKVRSFFEEKKPVGAICHGTIVLARTIDPQTNQSIISDYKTTGLLKRQELMAYYLTKNRVGDYYRTYTQTVQDEVINALTNKKNFKKGNMGLLRDSYENLNRGFVVKDRHYISSRWPGDAYSFSLEFLKMLKK